MAISRRSTPEVIFRNLGTPVPPMSQSELDIRASELIEMIPGQQQSNILLRGYVAEELARLDDQIELVNALAERDLARDVDHAMIAAEPRGQATPGVFHGPAPILRRGPAQLVAHAEPAPAAPGRGPTAGTGPEKSPARSGPAATDGRTAGRYGTGGFRVEDSGLGLGDSGSGSVTTEAQVAVATDAASRDREPRVEATSRASPDD